MRARRQIRKVGSTSEAKAVLYCRVSSERQKESGLGIEDQERRLRQWAQDQGVADYVVITDEAESGKKLDRSGYRRALDLLRTKERNLLVVVKLDRLARNVREVLDLRDRLQQEAWNVVVLDGSVQLDTRSANGKLALNMFAAVAEWESDMAGERTRDAYAAKRRREDVQGVIAADLEARILAMVDSGLGLNGTADKLNAEGVPTAKGGKWYASTVSRVVRREENRASA